MNLRNWLREKTLVLEAVGDGPGLDDWREELRALAIRAGLPSIVEACDRESSLGVLLASALAETRKRPAAPVADGPLTAQQTAYRLNVSQRQVYALCARGELRHSKHPIRILPADLEAYQKEARREPTLKLALRHFR